MQRTRAGMWAVLVVVGSAALQAGCGEEAEGTAVVTCPT